MYEESPLRASVAKATGAIAPQGTSCTGHGAVMWLSHRSTRSLGPKHTLCARCSSLPSGGRYYVSARSMLRAVAVHHPKLGDASELLSSSA